MKQDDDIEKLKWVRIFSPVHIPKYLVEQVRDRDYSVEDFYKLQEQSCLNQDENGFHLNPLNHLYVLVDNENMAKGFSWFTIDPLSKDICLQTYSVDEKFWNKGKAVSKIAELLKDVRKKANLKKIYWITNYPKHSEKYGFKRSKSVLMEYKEEETENGKNS